MDGALHRKLVEGERRRLGWARWVVPAAAIGWCGFLALAACVPSSTVVQVLGTQWHVWAAPVHLAWIALAPAIVLAPCWAEERQRGTIEGLMLTTAPVEALVRIKLEARLLPWMAVLPLGGIALAVLVSPAEPGSVLAVRALADFVWCAGACALSIAAASFGCAEHHGWIGSAMLSLVVLCVLESISSVVISLPHVLLGFARVAIPFEALALVHGIAQAVLARYFHRLSIEVLRTNFEYPTR